MDALLGLLNNDAVLTVLTLAWGFIVKYNPALARVPNSLIPYLNALLALLVKLAAPDPAHAASGVTVETASFLGKLLSAGWQAILSSLVYEVFLRAPTSTVLTKPRVPR